jgi:hypothetical protein
MILNRQRGLAVRANPSTVGVDDANPSANPGRVARLGVLASGSGCSPREPGSGCYARASRTRVGLLRSAGRVATLVGLLRSAASGALLPFRGRRPPSRRGGVRV